MDKEAIVVTTDTGDFRVGPYFLGPQGKGEVGVPGEWAIVAVSPDPLTPPRFLSSKFQTAEAAWRAYSNGFEVIDPQREPRLKRSKIVAGMLKSPKVKVA